MGCCLSCLQDGTTPAENAHIVPMGQEFSHYEQPKASDEPKAAASNPYGPRTMSVVLRMNRAEQNAGNYKVGCDLDDRNVVTKVKEGTPAARAGMRVGDQITEVDGEPLAGRKVQDVLAMKALHTFTILRGGESSPPVTHPSQAAPAHGPPGMQNEVTSIAVVELVRTPLGFGLSVNNQNKVVAITRGSQAERSGFFALQDRLVSLNGQPLRGSLEEQLGAIAVGTKVSIEISRRR